MEPIRVSSEKEVKSRKSEECKLQIENEINQNNNNNQTEHGSINELKRKHRTASEEQREFEQVLDGFRNAKNKKQERETTIAISKLVLDDPSSTLRSTTRAQAKLGYTQTSAMLTWQNISCDNDNDIRLFPTCGYVKPGQMLCVLGGGDNAGIADLFRILRDPSRIYNSKDHGTYVAHGDILLNGLPPGKFYKRFVFLIYLLSHFMQNAAV